MKPLGKSAEDPVERGTLSADEITRIIALPGAHPRARAAILLSALCGLRMGEVRGLQWEDVDFDRLMLKVHHNYVTDEEGLKGPLSSALAARFPSHRQSLGR